MDTRQFLDTIDRDGWVPVDGLLSTAQVAEIRRELEKALQKLGFLAQTPASLEEYYAPPEKRKFRQRYE